MSQDGPGKPRLWKTADSFQKAIDNYFALFEGSNEKEHPKHGKAPNLFGLCVHAKMSYDAFIDYESGDMDTEIEKYGVAGKAARMKVLEYAGEHMFSHTAGSVFSTVNNTKKFKEAWRNAQANEVTGPNGGPLQFEGISIKIVKGGDAPGNTDT